MNNLEGTGLERYAEDCIDLDKEFNLTHLHEPTMMNIGFLALALAGEVGELVNIVKKIWRDGESPKLWKKFDEEAVDVLIYFVELLNAARCPIDKAWEEKRKILYRRMHKQYGYELDDVPLRLHRIEKCKDKCNNDMEEVCAICIANRYFFPKESVAK